MNVPSWEIMAMFMLSPSATLPLASRNTPWHEVAPHIDSESGEAILSRSETRQAPV